MIKTKKARIREREKKMWIKNHWRIIYVPLKLNSFFFSFRYFCCCCCYLRLVCHVLIPYAFRISVMPSIKTNASFIILEKHTESHWENCGRCYDTRCTTYNHNSCPIVTFGRGRFIYLLLLANASSIVDKYSIRVKCEQWIWCTISYQLPGY